MKLSHFILLTAEEKKSALLHQGVLVGKKRHEEQMVFLFQFPNFYVESFFHPATKGAEEFRMYTDPGPLNDYLETVSLSGLLP